MYRTRIADWSHFPGDTVKIIYAGTGDCSARRLLADIYADVDHCGTESWIKEYGNDMPKDFVLDVFAALKAMSLRHIDLLSCCDPTVYHEGEGGEMPSPREGGLCLGN